MLQRQTKTLVSIYNVSPTLQVDLLSVTFDPKTAEIRLLVVTHPLAAITLQPSKL